MRNTSRREPAGEPSVSSPTSGGAGAAVLHREAGDRVADNGGTTSVSGPLAPRGRRTTVRTRLLLGLMTGVLAVLLAGAPAVYGAIQDLSRTQQLLDDAEFGQRALSLAFDLADEREVVTVAVATTGAEAADDGPVDKALSEEGLARVDRRIDELQADAPGPLRGRLDTVATVREQARQGAIGAVETHLAYSAVLTELTEVNRSVSRAHPERAAGPGSGALPDLARAVDSAAASRTLLVTALSGTGPQGDLVSLAQRSHARETAALEDFVTTAGDEANDRYTRTVTGALVTAAEDGLERLTAEPYLTEDARQTDVADLGETLSTRIELQRSVLSSLTAEQHDGLAELRDDDVTALQVRVALVAVGLLLTLGVGVYTARSLTRPLAAVRLGSRRIAEDPAGQRPVRYTGRDDEFATVIASVNELHARAVELHQEGSRATEDRGDLRAELDALRGEQQELVEQMAAQTGLMHTTLLYHARRSLDLAAEQLRVIDRLEEHETDPDQLATLFSLDHLAARMRRHSENVLLLTGVEIAPPPPVPVSLVDVAFGALSEAARYELVDVDQWMPAVRIVQPAARDLSHLLAELLDNATASAPPGTRVRMAGTVQQGTVTISVADDGPGLDDEILAAMNAQLANPTEQQPPPDGAPETPGAANHPGTTGPPVGMGLYTVARLAVRHGLRPRLAARDSGGLRAEVEIPAALVQRPGAPAPTVPEYPPQAAQRTVRSPAAPSPAGATSHAIGQGTVAQQRDEEAKAPGPDADHVTHGPVPSGGNRAWDPADAAEPQDTVDAPGQPALPALPAQAGAAAPAGSLAEPGSGVPEPEPERGAAAGPYSDSCPAAPPGDASAPVPYAEEARASADSVDPAGGQPATTAGGLPIRVPSAALNSDDQRPGNLPSPDSSGAVPEQHGPSERSGAVDAEELRRRLGGFQRGAREGHRDAQSAGPPADEEM